MLYVVLDRQAGPEDQCPPCHMSALRCGPLVCARRGVTRHPDALSPQGNVPRSGATVRVKLNSTPILPACYDQGCGLPSAVGLAHLGRILWGFSAMEIYSVSSAAAAATAPRLNASGCQSQQRGVNVGTFALHVVALARVESIHSDDQTPMRAVCVTCCCLRCIQSKFVYTREDTRHPW